MIRQSLPIDELALIAGTDIPFPQAQLQIHQPRIREISFLGEGRFYNACNFFRFDKENLSAEDKSHLTEFTNFKIIVSMIQKKDPITIKSRRNLESFLSILFPNWEVQFNQDEISLKNGEEIRSINEDNFEEFKNILLIISCLQKPSQVYNPAGDLSSKIAAKLQRGKAKAAQNKKKSDDDSGSLIGRYMSILVTGGKKTYQELGEYTLYQLFDEFKRFELKSSYDTYISAKLAGASGMKDVDNWMKNIHDD